MFTKPTRLGRTLAAFAGRELDGPKPYLILDARYEKVREDGVTHSQAVLVAIGVGWDGRRHILGVELAGRESRSSWKAFLAGLRERGLHGVEFVVSGDHGGLVKAIREVLSEAAWQRCMRHPRVARALPSGTPSTTSRARPKTTASRNRAGSTTATTSTRRAPTSLPGSADGRPSTPGSPTGSRTASRRPGPPAACRASTTGTSKSTNMLERLNEEIRRRTRVVRIFPNRDSCLRLVRALAVETHEDWLEASRYLNMDFLGELRKEELWKAAWAHARQTKPFAQLDAHNLPLTDPLGLGLSVLRTEPRQAEARPLRASIPVAGAAAGPESPPSPAQCTVTGRSSSG